VIETAREETEAIIDALNNPTLNYTAKLTLNFKVSSLILLTILECPYK
jgi:hypothetical protein